MFKLNCQLLQPLSVATGQHKKVGTCVFLPGWGFHSQIFTHWVSTALSYGYQCLCLDFFSVKGDFSGVSPKFVADQFPIMLCDYHEIESRLGQLFTHPKLQNERQIYLIGWSLGGLIALLFNHHLKQAFLDVRVNAWLLATSPCFVQADHQPFYGLTKKQMSQLEQGLVSMPKRALKGFYWQVFSKGAVPNKAELREIQYWCQQPWDMASLSHGLTALENLNLTAFIDDSQQWFFAVKDDLLAWSQQIPEQLGVRNYHLIDSGHRIFMEQKLLDQFNFQLAGEK